MILAYYIVVTEWTGAVLKEPRVDAGPVELVFTGQHPELLMGTVLLQAHHTHL